MNQDIDYKLESEDNLNNEPLISFIDNDLVLDFLNDCEHPIKPSQFIYFHYLLLKILN